MDRYLKLLFIIALCDACASRQEKSVVTEPKDLPVIKFLGTESRDHGIMIVNIEPIENIEKYSILGIKMKIWTYEIQKIIRFIKEGDQYVPYEEDRPVRKSLGKIPTHEPKFTIVVPANATSGKFEGLELGEEYEVRAHTFNELGDGPLSDAMGRMVGDEKPIPTNRRRVQSTELFRHKKP